MKTRFAIPTADKKLTAHFGHCAEFAIINVEDGKIVDETYITPPPHEPGLLPKWLHQQGVNIIIAGGMGQRAQTLFAQNKIEVSVGAPSEEPSALVLSYLNNSLKTGNNLCDH